ncbi:hypothetical protein ACFE04_026592 [Oxalis oulophora]
MLDYQWGNPTNINMLTGDEHVSQPDQSRQNNIFDHHHYHNHLNNNNNQHFLHQNTTTFPHNNFIDHTQMQQHHALYDPRAYTTTTNYTPHYHQQSMLALDSSVGGGGYFVVPKNEEVSGPVDYTAARIGLNLGGRTYFSSAEDDFVNRLYRRSRPGEPGSINAPRCQAEGCNADLTHAKHYHRRHKVCEFHSKASTVLAAGLTQRFCQQCSRFHLLSEFDNGKRSCRKRLADHNRRRRKSQQPAAANNNQESQKSQQSDNAPSDNLTRSPPDSGAPSPASVTVAVSPPRISLDCFRQSRPYQQATMSSSSTSSLFFSSG